MDPLSTPTTASAHAYQTFSVDDISIISSTTDEFFDADSFIYNPSAASSDSIASYKTEKTINSRKSRFIVPPRHKYANIERLKLPRGPVSLDFDCTSVLDVCRTIKCQDGYTYTSTFQTNLKDESDEATKTTRTKEGLMEAHQEYEALLDDIIQTVKRSVYQSAETESFLLTV